MKNGSPFDNLDEVCVKPGDIRKGKESAAVTQRRERLEQQFIKVPMSWIDRLAETKRRATVLVALQLLRLSWKKNSNTVSLPNSGLTEWGRCVEAIGSPKISYDRGDTEEVTTHHLTLGQLKLKLALSSMYDRSIVYL